MIDEDDEFEMFFDTLYPRTLALARRILGDPLAAEDVAAEAFARAYARWGKVGPLPYRDGWVLKTATNLAVDALRRRRPTQPAEVVVNEEEATALRLALGAALRSLSRRQREVIALRYLIDLTEADVATALGISAGSVKTHLHRGIAALRARLGERAEEELANAFQA